MASSTRNGSRFTRRILWLAAGITILVLAYTLTWYYLAQALEQRAAAAVEDLNGNGVRAHCEEAQAQGYPFRIGIACRSVFYENSGKGLSVRAGAMRSLANVYQPFTVFSEFTDPADITLPVFHPFKAQWKNLQASTRLSDPFPEQISVEGEGVVVSDNRDRGLGEVESLQLHVRQRGADADLAISFREFLFNPEIATVPALEGRAQAIVENGVALLETGALAPRDQSAVIEEMVVGVVGEETEVSLSGPVSVDESGLIDAELTIRFTDAATVARILADAVPEARGQIASAATVLGNLDNTPIQLKIVRGRVFLGFIPLGQIPAI
ncbi:DUF2125 domain-containing protein [Chelativorans sp. YIM 93263]|uniref:DUF2125 domain-containing protein n=1 Tax=Chelativorans sp. YIM 93263 TaxID=2906648 RepID=UPI00237836C1|nr:DUF2125 domain-containing protein [Chelativorans sp. YIM 93263]